MTKKSGSDARSLIVTALVLIVLYALVYNIAQEYTRDILDIVMGVIL